MTTYTHSSDGTTVESYRQPKPAHVETPENGIMIGVAKGADQTGGKLTGLGKVVKRVGLLLATYFDASVVKDSLVDGVLDNAAAFEAQMDVVASVVQGTAEEMASLSAEAERVGDLSRKLDEGPVDQAASGADSIIDASGNGNHGPPSGGPVYRAA